MKELEESRKLISEIDSRMAALFEKRLEIAGRIAAYKRAEGLPLYDKAREEAVIEAAVSNAGDPALKGHISRFFKGILDISKSYQSQVTGAGVLTCPTIQGCYELHIGRGLIDKCGSIFNLDRKVLVVTDSGVPQQYSDAILSRCTKGYKFTFPQGEESKNLSVWQEILSTLHENGFTRSDAIVAVGGGVVGDMAGFAAASYMRGICFYNVPTTLLSQADSSVGGKTGVDFEGVKNTVGAFWQPSAVIIDPDCLDTLPERLFNEGMAEIIKIAATSSTGLFELLEQTDDIRTVIEQVIREAVTLKRDVVISDTLESGPRRVLNFGHTIGHAIEAASEGSLYHGEAVAAGMMYMCSPNIAPRLGKLLRKFFLPTTDPFDEDTLMSFIAHDKKAHGITVSIVYVPEIGRAELTESSLEAIRDLIAKRKTSL